MGKGEDVYCMVRIMPHSLPHKRAKIYFALLEEMYQAA